LRQSLNPAIDLGQIEGAFVQGQGWLTCEELWWDKEGRPAHRRPLDLQDSRQPRRAGDLQRQDARQRATKEATIFRSKAVGEPPLMLATAVWNAPQGRHRRDPAERRTAVRLDAPATPERILAAIARLKA
jgi:xanthine dehydrogenase large subunit